MDWLSLIPAGISLLSGLFGGNSTKNNNDSSIDKSTGKILTEAGKVFSRPYQAYTGQRVAAPTASRTAMNPLMNQIGNVVQGQLTDANGLQGRARQLLNMGPQRISVPTMVPGGPQVGMTPPPTTAPLMLPPPQQQVA